MALASMNPLESCLRFPKMHSVPSEPQQGHSSEALSTSFAEILTDPLSGDISANAVVGEQLPIPAWHAAQTSNGNPAICSSHVAVLGTKSLPSWSNIAQR